MGRRLRTAAIVNPASAGGRTARLIGEIEARLRARFDLAHMRLTSRPGEGVDLARAALKDGCELIVAVGGDGTLNEVVNGFFENGAPVAPDAALAVAASGSGGDFRRSLGPALGALDAIDALARARPRRIDVGRACFTGPDGEPAERLFLNIASVGLSGEVVARVERSRFIKRLGGAFAFRWAGLVAALRFHPWPVRLQVDDHDETLDMALIAVCNGRYFGGGMAVAPHAALDDGLLDVIVIQAAARRDLILRMNDLYSGAHLNHPGVRMLRGRKVAVTPLEPARPAPAECDGEGGVRSPATFDVTPAALTLLS